MNEDISVRHEQELRDLEKKHERERIKLEERRIKAIIMVNQGKPIKLVHRTWEEPHERSDGEGTYHTTEHATKVYIGNTLLKDIKGYRSQVVEWINNTFNPHQLIKALKYADKKREEVETAKLELVKAENATRQLMVKVTEEDEK